MVDFQLVSPHDHRRNIAEKAIQVFEDHVVLVLCGTDIKFPLQLWNRILPQVEHQLNLLSKSRVDPINSNFEIMQGKHDYNSNPFTSLNVAVEMYGIPDTKQEGNMGIPYKSRVLPRYILGSLQMPLDLDQRH